MKYLDEYKKNTQNEDKITAPTDHNQQIIQIINSLMDRKSYTIVDK